MNYDKKEERVKNRSKEINGRMEGGTERKIMTIEVRNPKEEMWTNLKCRGRKVKKINGKEKEKWKKRQTQRQKE